MESMTRLRADIVESIYKNTSSNSLIGTKKLLTKVIYNQELTDSLMNCSPRAQCNLVSCPTCSRVRGKRYFKQSLKPVITKLDSDELYWITINTNTTPDLDDSEFRITQHRSLKTIIDASNLSKGEKMPWDWTDMRVWGCREVEPIIQSDGKFHWKWHWHLITYLGDVNIDTFTSRIRSRWHESHAVRVDPIRGRTEYLLNKSLMKLAMYPVKSRFTYLNPIRNDDRTWLPPETLNQLVEFRESRGVKWNRFVFGRNRT